MLGMLGTALLFVGIGAAFPQASGGAQAPLRALAAPPSTMEMTITAESPAASDGQIYVDEDCGFYPGLTIPITFRKRPPARFDSAICHLEGFHSSEHREEIPLGTELERRNVRVNEQEFVLQNITMKPAIFAVLVEVPKGWSVDSDPQPTEIEGDVAIFRVHAEVGETVRLHVGIRRTKDLKPKPLGAGGP
jgi:hypothetical protein